jgi:hypothetical protein
VKIAAAFNVPKSSFVWAEGGKKQIIRRFKLVRLRLDAMHQRRGNTRITKVLSMPPTRFLRYTGHDPTSSLPKYYLGAEKRLRWVYDVDRINLLFVRPAFRVGMCGSAPVVSQNSRQEYQLSSTRSLGVTQAIDLDCKGTSVLFADNFARHSAAATL